MDEFAALLVRFLDFLHLVSCQPSPLDTLFTELPLLQNHVHLYSIIFAFRLAREGVRDSYFIEIRASPRLETYCNHSDQFY